MNWIPTLQRLVDAGYRNSILGRAPPNLRSAKLSKFLTSKNRIMTALHQEIMQIKNNGMSEMYIVSK
jgi:hypothetical protein